ncbi:MAG TPA: hypothetical protein VGC84_14050, partial [Ilumatobacteraceae bacterium]
AAVSAVEKSSSAEIALATSADADLAIAERLARELGSNVNRAAELRGDLVARRNLTRVATDAAALRRELEAVDSERRDLFGRWSSLDQQVSALADEERSIRDLALRCHDKIANVRPLAIPSVAALEPLTTVDDLETMPWTAARAVMAPVMEKVVRLDAALGEARRRYQQPLDDRDDLRGLLQSFRGKADAHGLAEDAELEPLYRQAESVLWSAPCDLQSARSLVDQYVRAVNAKITSSVPDRGVGS